MQQESYQELHCFTKHFPFDQKYKLFLMKDKFLIGKDWNQIKYQCPLKLHQKILWKKESNNLVAFGIETSVKLKWFYIKNASSFKKMISGKVLFKNMSLFYNPLKYLETGSTTQVYLVFSKDNPTEYYTCKCISKEQQQNEEMEQFLKEIGYLQQIKHNSIVKLFEAFEGDKSLYMILDYFEGGNLEDLIKSRKKGFSVNEIKLIMRQIMEGLQYMHAMGLMHRDLKPEHIMFQKKAQLNTLKIIDFGLATKINSLNKAVGSIGYMAPEVISVYQQKKKQFSEKIDIFSAGAIMYKLYTLKNLFEGDSEEEIFNKNLQNNQNLSILVMYNTSKTSVDLIRKMLFPNPSQRISAEEVLNHPFFHVDDSKPFLSAEDRKKLFQKKIQTKQNLNTWDIYDDIFEETNNLPPIPKFQTQNSPHLETN